MGHTHPLADHHKMQAARNPHRSFYGLSWQDVALIAIPASIAVAVLLWFASEVVRPPPPERLIMTAGPEGGGYAHFAERYRTILGKSGILLTVQNSAGSMENVSRLTDPKSAVDVGFVQSGSVSDASASKIVSLGSMYYEPLWVFYRGKRTLTRCSFLCSSWSRRYISGACARMCIAGTAT